MLPIISGEFRLVADPELRFTPSGIGVASLRLVADKQKKVEENGETKWVDDKVCWLNGTAWGRQGGGGLAENVAESLRKGDLVEVRGALETRNYETADGEKRTSLDVNIYSIGPSLRFRPILHSDGAGNKVTREGAVAPGETPASDDPWATPASTDEPPFSGGS